MRLPVTVVVVLLVGCSKETETQKCERLGKAASVAVAAYVNTREAEQRRLEAIDRELSDRFDAVMDQGKLLFDAREAGKCGYVEGFATRAQPTTFMVRATRERMFPAIQASRDLLRLEGPELVLPPETVAAVTRVTDSFESASERWSDIIVPPVRPGRRWSAKQRTYLTSLEAGWCELQRVLDEVIDPRVKVVLRETKRLGDQRDPVIKAASDYLSVTTHAYELQADLARDPWLPVELPEAFATDPAFASTWPAIKAFNLCRD
jgi:hypothetical protein